MPRPSCSSPLLVVLCGVLACGGSLAGPAPLALAAPTPGAPSSTRGGPAATRLVGVQVVGGVVRTGGTVRVRGRLLDAAAHPVVGRQVGLAAIGPQGFPDDSFTGPDGSFTLGGSVPPGTAAGPLSLAVAFQGDEDHLPAETRVALTVAAGGAPLVSPSPAVVPAADPDAPGPAPQATVLSPAPASPVVAPARATDPRALPLWLRWTMAALAFVGVLLGLAVASRQQREPEEYHHFIGAGEDSR